MLITALSTKEAAAIVLNSLELSAVEMWGNRVIDFEKKYRVKWDRTTIPRDVRDQINIRWSQEIYNIHLPPTLVTSIESGEGFADDQWLEPHIISTEELYKYLKKSISMEKKRTSFKTGFEEVLEYIKNYRLSFGTGTAHKSVEKFLAQSKRLYQESMQTITHHEEKELCKATCKMVEEAQQSDADMLERIVEKERHSPPPPSKPYNPGTAVDPKDICNGCGRRLTDKHTESTCYYILDKLDGYNPDYKTVKWHDSAACAKLRKEGKPEPLLFLSAPREHKASGGGGEILCCSISNPSLYPLPIISSVLIPAQQDRNEEVTIMVEEDTGTENP